jgi:DNA-binding transcriptional LysR family regulator
MIDDLRHVRSFLAAARLGNFTRAAAELHISQSAFTVQIRQLEDALGVTLFDRSKRRIRLTTPGKDVLAPLERLLVDAEAVLSRTREIAGLRRGIVTVAVLPSVAANFLPSILRDFTKRHPAISVQIRDVVAERILNAVRSEEADFGIGSSVRANRELSTIPLFVDKLCAFVHKSHVLARQPSVTLRELSVLPLILTGRESSVRELVDRALKREKLTITIAYEANYLSTALSMVRARLGIAILPESASTPDYSSDVRSIPIARPALSRKIELIQKADRSLSPAAAKLIDLIQQHAMSSR